MGMNRRTFMASVGAGTVLLGVSGRAALSQTQTLRIGVLQPQAGDCAQWGLPNTRGAQVWADQHNEAGGLLAGDGKRYNIEIVAYDNVCYVPGEELRAARRAALDDGVHFLFQTFTPACRQAIADLVQEQKVLTTAYGSGYLSGDYPYLMGGLTGSPTANMLVVSHVLEKRPEIKRVALLTTNNSFGLAAKAYAEAGVAAFGDRVEIVHNQSYDPAAASDMLGLLTPVAGANADLIFQMGLVPAQQAQLIETMNQLGFKGVFAGEQWILPYILQRNSGESIASRLYGAFTVEAAEPTYSPRAHDFYQRYLKKFGENEWTTDASATYCALGTVEVGLAASPSIEAGDVMEALYKMETVEHPVFGASRWGGADIFGANHHLLTPLPVYNTDAAGAFTVDGVVDPAAWWAANGQTALPKLQAGGQVFKS